MKLGGRDPETEDLRSLSDEEVMVRCARGSEPAFEILVERYQSRVINLITRFIGDYDRAEDIAQEVFIRVYRNRQRYRKSGKFSTWIFTIAANLAKNEIRRKVRHRRVVSIDEEREFGTIGDTLPDPGPGPRQTLERRELEVMILQAIEELPDRYRMALVLRDIEGLSYDEVSKVLGIPGGTVRSRINRARLMVKEKLESLVRVDFL
ncbi:MAG: sigma-70 family RNA polymerase sigma factor [Candidatus Eiseniibacteriota bacterium]